MAKDFSKFFAIENVCEKITKYAVITAISALGVAAATSITHDALEKHEIEKQNKKITNNNKGGQR